MELLDAVQHGNVGLFVPKAGKKVFPLFHGLSLDLSWCFYLPLTVAFPWAQGHLQDERTPSQAPRGFALQLSTYTQP